MDNRLYYPLAVMLASRLQHVGSLSSLWEQFITDKIAAFCSASSDASPSMIQEQLEKLAFCKVSAARNQPKLSSDVEGVCIRAGLLRQTPEGVSFEIRPLEQHLAARSILRRIRESKKLSSEIALEDINQREVLRAVSEQAGTDPTWLGLVVDTLSFRPGDMRTQGDRLAFAAYCLSAQQFKASPKLREVVARLIEILVSSGDDVEKERCLDALVRQPDLLDPNLVTVEAFFQWIIQSGSNNAVLWLFRLFASNNAFGGKFISIWIKAAVRCLDDGTLGKHVQSIIQFKIERWMGNSIARFLAPTLTIARLLLLFFGQYGIYIAAWGCALLLAGPLFALFPKAPSYDFEKVWAMQFDLTKVRFQLERIYALLIFFYIPRYYLNGSSGISWGFFIGAFE